MQLVEFQVINLDYCPTQENMADVFTKTLPRKTIDRLGQIDAVLELRGGLGEWQLRPLLSLNSFSLDFIMN